MLTAGYFQTNYFCEDYWADDYWPEYGVPVADERIKKGTLFGVYP